MRGNARRVTIAILLSAAAVAEAQPARDIARIREELELLRGAIGAMSGEVGDRDVQLAELERRVAELSQRASATEAVARAQTDNAMLVQQQQLAAQVEALRAEMNGFLDAPVPSQVEHVDGFVWTTDDEKYQLRLGGYLQGRFSVDSRGSDQDSAFSLRRARLVIDGTGELGLGFRLATELVPEPALVDAWLQLTKGRVAVRAGRDRVPIGRSLLVPENQLPFPEVPVATEALGWGRDIGAQVRVETMRGLVTTTLAVMNGGPEGATPDDFPLVAMRNEIAFGRVASEPEDALVKGRAIAFAYGFAVDQLEIPAMVDDVALVPDRDGNGEADRLGVMAHAFDLTVRRDGFQLAAEVLARIEMWGEWPQRDAALAMLLGSSRPIQKRVAASLDLTQMLGRTVMFGTRLAGGQLPVFSLRGPSTVPPADRAVELDAVLGFHRKAKRVFTLGYRFVQYGHTLFGRDGGRVHTVTAEAQLEL